MIRTLPISQVRPGMYVHAPCGTWLDKPFQAAKTHRDGKLHEPPGPRAAPRMGLAR